MTTLNAKWKNWVAKELGRQHMPTSSKQLAKKEMKRKNYVQKKAIF